MKKISVRNKLVIWVVAVIAVFGSVATFGVYHQTKKRLIQFQQTNLILSAEKESEILAKIFDSSNQILKKVSQREEIVNYLLAKDQSNQEEENDWQFQDPQILAILENYNVGENYESIYILDESGLTLASTDPSFTGNNYRFRDYFKQAMANQISVDVAIGVTSQKLGFYFAAPVKQNQQVIGVIALKLSPDEINQSLYLSDEHADKNVSFSLIDEFGIIMAGSEEYLYKSLGTLDASEQNLVKEKKRYGDKSIIALGYENLYQELKNYSDTITSVDFNIFTNEEKFVIINRINAYPFYVLAEVDQQSIVLHTRYISIYMALIVAFAAIVASLIIYWFIKKLLSPVEVLKNLADKVSKGDFSDRADIKTGDDIEDLAKALNKMIDRVVAKERQTEYKVAQQTKILQKQADNLENQQQAILNVLEDVEAEKERSLKYIQDLEKFELALSQASDVIVITDEKGVIIYANPAVEKVTGYKVKKVIGQKAGSKDNWGGQMDKNVYQKIWKTIKQDKQTYSGEVTNKRKDGSIYIAEISIFPVLDKKKNVQFFVCIERDITKAKEIDRMKTEFISLASHQLRTPLSAMKWFLEMILNGDAGKLTKGQKEYITNISQSNERMIQLVNALLNVSRIETGKIIIEPKLTDFEKLVKSSIDELKIRFENKKQKIKIVKKKKISRIKIDAKLIQHVLSNILTNANKYTPEGGKITVTINKDKKSLICSVADTGYGIPESQQQYVFGKFFRGDNIIAKETDGTGLGLYLAKLIIEASGGAIWFESKENKGTTFTFSLPLEGSKSTKGEIRLVK